MAYRIGKHTGENGKLEHAFDIEPNGAGGIRIINISELGEPERTLIFAHFGRDDQTRSTWDLFGQAIAGPMEGKSLEGVEHLDTFWFAIAAFAPDAVIVDLT